MTQPIGSHEKHIVLIPTWVRDVFKRAGLNANAVLDYQQVDKALPLSERAVFLAHQKLHGVALLDTTLTDYLLKSWEQTCTDVQKVELASTVVPLSNTEAVIADAAERLTQGACPDVDAWCVVDLDVRHLAVYVGSGIATQLSDKDKAVKFLRDIVGHLSNYLSNQDLSQKAFFKRYVAALDASLL